MIQELKFVLYAIKKNIQSSVELRTSFFMSVVGMMINNISFIIVWVFFVQSVGVIGGWTASDIVALQGYTALCFGVVFSVGAGIRKLPQYVATGAFDRFMLSPKNLLMRVATSSFSASAVGDVLFGVVSLVIYAVLIDATVTQVVLMLLLVVISTVVFFAATITIYSISFLFTDPESAVNGIFEFFFTPALFHGGAFQGPLRFFFTFIVPSLLIGTIPVEIVRNVSFDTLALLITLAVIWLFLSIYLFNRAVHRYESSNFMTFGA